MTNAADEPEGTRAESSRASVLFNGEWSREDRGRIEAVVRRVDGLRPAAPLAPMLGRAWICNCHVVKGRRFFMAHWNCRPGTVLTARTADDLAEKMLHLAAAPPGDDGR